MDSCSAMYFLCLYAHVCARVCVTLLKETADLSSNRAPPMEIHHRVKIQGLLIGRDNDIFSLWSCHLTNVIHVFCPHRSLERSFFKVIEDEAQSVNSHIKVNLNNYIWLDQMQRRDSCAVLNFTIQSHLNFIS